MNDSLISIIVICIFVFCIWYTCKDIFYSIWDYYNIKHIVHLFNKEGKRFYKSMNSFIYFLNKCHKALIEDGIKGYNEELDKFYNKVKLIKNRFDRSLNEINKYKKHTLSDYIEDYRIALGFDNLVNKTTTIKDMRQCTDDFRTITFEFNDMINDICS